MLSTLVSSSRTKYLEHVLLRVDYTSLSHGEASITLISPSGTESKMLTPREAEKDMEARSDWTYMSVQFWGEDPNGIWKLKIHQGGSYHDIIYETANGNIWLLYIP